MSQLEFPIKQLQELFRSKVESSTDRNKMTTQLAGADEFAKACYSKAGSSASVTQKKRACEKIKARGKALSGPSEKEARELVVKEYVKEASKILVIIADEIKKQISNKNLFSDLALINDNVYGELNSAIRAWQPINSTDVPQCAPVQAALLDSLEEARRIELISSECDQYKAYLEDETASLSKKFLPACVLKEYQGPDGFIDPDEIISRINSKKSLLSKLDDGDEKNRLMLRVEYKRIHHIVKQHKTISEMKLILKPAGTLQSGGKVLKDFGERLKLEATQALLKTDLAGNRFLRNVAYVLSSLLLGAGLLYSYKTKGTCKFWKSTDEVFVDKMAGVSE